MHLFHPAKSMSRAQSREQKSVFCSLFSVFCSVSCLLLGPPVAGKTSAQAPLSEPASGGQTPFVEPTDLNPAIPAPESIIGYAVGSEAVRYPVLVRYLNVLAEASERVTLTDYGQTHEGRTLYYLTITSPANHKRLDQIKESCAKLSDPRKLKGLQQANQLIDTLPAVAWLNYSIHGDELSSTDAAMYVAYHLAAAKDEATAKLLDQVVVHINPLVNPDGRERYLSHLEQLTGVVSSPDYQSMQHQALWSRGRGNHYLFDLNRDWLVHIQPELRALAEVILAWNPHLLVDSHEQSPYDTYLFDPPRAPINPQLSAKVLDWRKRFGADQADAFDHYGWSYYTRDWYSEWGPIYTHAWGNLQGAIGLLYEQARVDAASVKHPTGKEVTYRETVHHHIVSSLANLKTLCANRREILLDFLGDRQLAISEHEPHGKMFLLPPSQDTDRWKRLVELIKHHGIEVEFAQDSFEAEDVTDIWANKLPRQSFPKGTLVADCRQPHRRILSALCEFDPHWEDSFLQEERKELENRRPTLLYDVTSWNLPMAFGLEAYWAKSLPNVKLSREPSEPVAPPVLSCESKNRGYGYLIDFANSNIYPLLVRLFDNNCHPRIATKPFQNDGQKYKAGTVLLRGHENPDDLLEILPKIACPPYHPSEVPSPSLDTLGRRVCDPRFRGDKFTPAKAGADIHPVDSALSQDGPDLGSRKFELLAAPRAAIASQWPIQATSFGSIWFLLDYHLRLRCSPINIQNISQIDLRKYNILVLPDSSGLERVLNNEMVQKIKRWIEGGGTLIAIGNSAAWACDKDRGLSLVRLRHDVLDSLPEYQEAVQREKDALDVKVDSNQIWAVQTAAEQTTKKPDTEKSETSKPEESKAKADIEKLKRTDEWQRLFSPRGTFVTGMVNTEHWLGFGCNQKLPVMFWGSNAFMSKHPVATVVRLAEKDKLRLSGLLWPEAKERLADTAYATVESIGQGQLILFATDPTYRMWLPAMQRLFLNAILLGPGMGTSQPLPW